MKAVVEIQYTQKYACRSNELKTTFLANPAGFKCWVVFAQKITDQMVSEIPVAL